ncbi:MAG: hypothetical protein KJ069_02425 [Anaerolineae bacterium]|nr:hypothetical protein [Anaerolineae bacterium]
MNENEQTNLNNWSREAIGSQNYLIGKVVLLIGNDTAVLQTLITHLAQKGADIVLVCQHWSVETIRRVKESVESLGRRFLFIENTERKQVSADLLVQNVVSSLGHLDIFIDLSAQKRGLNQNGKDYGQPNWQLAQAALEEIAG